MLYTKVYNKKGGRELKIKKEAVIKLVAERFRNNKSCFADTIGLNVSYVNQVLNNKRDASSPKMCNAIIKYCSENNIDYQKYIFLE